MPVATREECERVSNENNIEDVEKVIKSHLCVGDLSGDMDACRGDYGAPLVCKMSDGSHVLAGVMSFGDGCTKKGHYTYYSSIPNQILWINHVIGLDLKP